MTGVPIFPGNLPGLGWSFHKKPRFDVRLAAHATGRETRARKYQRPLFDFELTYDGLDANATAADNYGGLGAQSFQTSPASSCRCKGALRRSCSSTRPTTRSSIRRWELAMGRPPTFPSSARSAAGSGWSTRSP